MNNDFGNVSAETAQYYRDVKDPEVARQEERVARLGMYLEGVTKTWLATTGSRLDTAHKADVLLDLEDDCSIGIQVKSSQYGADKHESLVGTIADLPGSVVANKNVSSIKILKRLQEITGLPYLGAVSDALVFANALSGRTVPARGMKNVPAYIELGLARSTCDGLCFIDNPPTLE